MGCSKWMWIKWKAHIIFIIIRLNTVVTDVPNNGGKLTVIRLLVEMSNVFLFFPFYKIFLFQEAPHWQCASLYKSNNYSSDKRYWPKRFIIAT